MRKYRYKRQIIACIVLIALLLVLVPLRWFYRSTASGGEACEEAACVSLWQIDGFEGGKGSRKTYLEDAFNRCFKGRKVYITAISLSAVAARENIAAGDLPDIISYPAGFYGIEGLLCGGERETLCWARGAYCFIALGSGCKFDDIDQNNTVVNGGRDNLTGVAAALCGVGWARVEEPVNAYTQLIGGKFKYLLGTQRDVFRLISRKVEFSVEPMRAFNDLYQNLGLVSKDKSKITIYNEFCEYLRRNSSVEERLGLFYDGQPKERELAKLCGVECEYSLKVACSEKYVCELKRAAERSDINKIKNLLK